jgi:hypothetical protein
MHDMCNKLKRLFVVFLKKNKSNRIVFTYHIRADLMTSYCSMSLILAQESYIREILKRVYKSDIKKAMRIF